MNYYNQKLVNRANRNSDADIKLGTDPSMNKPYLQNIPYESTYVNRSNNLIPNSPYENNTFQQNFNEPSSARIPMPAHGHNLNYQYTQNNNQFITSPFENIAYANNEDSNKKDPFQGKEKEDPSSSANWNKNDKLSKENKTEKKQNNKNQDNEEEEEELPLLEELGINFDQISKRMKSVFKFYTIDSSLFENSDLSGPLLIVLSLGFTLLLAGKASFSYIYLIGIVSSLSIYLLLNIMSQNLTLDLYRTISMLGYALLPLVILSSISIFLNLRTKKGYTISFFCILWSALTASRFFEAALQMNSQRYLIAYPIFLLYSCFALVIIF